MENVFTYATKTKDINSFLMPARRLRPVRTNASEEEIDLCILLQKVNKTDIGKNQFIQRVKLMNDLASFCKCRIKTRNLLLPCGLVYKDDNLPLFGHKHLSLKRCAEHVYT